jgi:hypothetical protein
VRGRRRTLGAVAVAVAVALGMMAPIAAADNATVQMDAPFGALTATNVCNSENVVFSGVIHVTSHTTNDVANGDLTTNHANFQNVQGVGDQGNAYRGQATGTSTLHQDPTNDGGFVDTGSGDLRFESKGSAPNFDAHIVFHVTETPSGQMIGQVEVANVTCQG